VSAAVSPGMSSRPGAVRVARAFATGPIVLYQKLISPALPRRCKYEPTCSRYAVEAIRSFGVGKGVVLAVWRLLRCNPWSYGGYDPVDAQRLFRLVRAPRPGRSPAHQHEGRATSRGR
jgi:putative membrane protein insertion efficiency factor